MADKVGVPTGSTVKGAFGDFAYGAIGGAVFGLVTALFGSGFLGLLAAPILAGSVVKGNRGTVIATVAGFLALASLFSGAGAAPEGGTSEVM